MLSRKLALAFLLLALLPLPAFAYTGATCLSDISDDHAACLAMIGAVRTMMTDESSTDPACNRGVTDDRRVIDGVVDWIRRNPERKDEDLVNLTREALLGLDPCTQRSLIPQSSPGQILGDPVDTE